MNIESILQMNGPPKGAGEVRRSLRYRWGDTTIMSTRHDTKFSDQEIVDFLQAQEWTFAKTYECTWPHEYIVRRKVSDDGRFTSAVHLLREEGYPGKFYNLKMTYYDHGDHTYWEMGSKTPETTDIINRCPRGQSYHGRLAAGTLPLPKGTQFTPELAEFIDMISWNHCEFLTIPWVMELLNDEAFLIGECTHGIPDVSCVLRNEVDEQFFVKLVRHLHMCGIKGKFYSQRIVYFDAGLLTYWTGGGLIAETTRIYRCWREQTLLARK